MSTVDEAIDHVDLKFYKKKCQKTVLKQEKGTDFNL